MKTLLIDIRKSDEVFRKHFDQNNIHKFYNIPMNMIRFNKQNIIEHLEYVDNIYIVCESSNRAQFIKDKYFSDIDEIKVNTDLQFSNLKIGENTINLDGETININVSGTDSFNLYNVMRILQLVLGALILSCGGYTYYQIKDKKINKIPLIILLVMGINAIYNGLTSTCTMTEILRNYLN